jgi:dynein heavy chain
MTLEPP